MYVLSIQGGHTIAYKAKSLKKYMTTPLYTTVYLSDCQDTTVYTIFFVTASIIYASKVIICRKNILYYYKVFIDKI